MKAVFLVPNKFGEPALNIRQVENGNNIHANKRKVTKLEMVLEKKAEKIRKQKDAF